MNPDSTEQEIINHDRVNHPTCQYAVDFSQVCSNRNHEGMVCETIRKLQRSCPGLPPTTIFSKKDQFHGNGQELDMPSMLGTVIGGLLGRNVQRDTDQFREFDSVFGMSPHGKTDNFDDSFPFADEFFSMIDLLPKSSALARKLPPHKQPSSTRTDTDNSESMATQRDGNNNNKSRSKAFVGRIQGSVEEI
jgi:hypothetical protein